MIAGLAVIGVVLGFMSGGFSNAAVWVVVGGGALLVDWMADRQPGIVMARAGLGLLAGTFVAFIAVWTFDRMQFAGWWVNRLALEALLGYVGVTVGLRWATGGGVPDGRRANDRGGNGRSGAGGVPKLLDTSVIIDGRIAEVCDTGFLEGIFYTPRFVLQELQRIADSSDPLKRNRGRRGLDILNRMQKSRVKIEVLELDAPETREVDEKLLIIGKQRGWKIITNDFNLNKVAEIHGVAVLNINDLANALKPAVLPGELLTIRVIKEGKEQGQGIGYLDDGTMVVVDNGKISMGQKIEVVVTSALQTAAGRMIFAKKRDEAGDIITN